MTSPSTQATAIFLGGGRITTAIVAGLRAVGSRQQIIVHDRHASKLRRLHKDFNVVVESDLRRAVLRDGLLIVAVRPDAVRDLLREISGSLSSNRVVVSLAAGIPLARLKSWSNGTIPWSRAMPSPVCRMGNGLTAVTFAANVPRQSRDKVRRFLAKVGSVVEIPESQFDAFSVTYSSTHGYHALAALTNAAVKIGLPRKLALAAAAHALGDGVVGWREAGISLKRLLDEAATPGGVAASTMAAMDKCGHARAVEAGLRGGMKRIRANARL